jgi:hypothetical protein
MQRQEIRLTRQELYEKVWSRPAISLAQEFGISADWARSAVASTFQSLPAATGRNLRQESM